MVSVYESYATFKVVSKLFMKKIIPCVSKSFPDHQQIMYKHIDIKLLRSKWQIQQIFEWNWVWFYVDNIRTSIYIYFSICKRLGKIVPMLRKYLHKNSQRKFFYKCKLLLTEYYFNSLQFQLLFARKITNCLHCPCQ